MGGLTALDAARSEGQDLSLETCPHQLLLDEKCAPPLRTRETVEELWRTVLDGIVDWIASEHSPCPPNMKQTDNIWSAWGGLGGVQTLLPALLIEGVHRRGLSLSRLVSLTAGVPAHRLGLYPRNGVLGPGSDADIALVDLEQNWLLEPSDLRTRWPISPLAGRSVRGHVVATSVRWTVVWEAGSPRVEPGYGQAAR